MPTPRFTLRGDNRLSGHILSIVAAFRMGDREKALVVFKHMLEKHMAAFEMSPDMERGTACMEASMRMFDWQKDNKAE